MQHLQELILLGLLVTVTAAPALASPSFTSAKVLGTVKDHNIQEASGLAASRIHPGVLYTHNDKGSNSVIYAIDASTAQTLATLKISHAENYDWEDVAVGPCGGSSCIYIAETGDHGEDGAKNVIYRVKEPKSIKDQSLDVDSKLHFKWDQPDCETVMVTPNEDIYLVSKVSGGHGKLVRLDKSGWGSGNAVTVQASATLKQDGHKHDPVGGDISPNGKEMLIKYKYHVYYWYVPDGDYVGAISRPPVDLPYVVETQGESVCWDSRAGGYYTLSEGKNQHLYYYQRTSPVVG
ncbi:hypothetical protein LOTGIDRAFT_169531 [Lottia gigantea]|uniref:Uncharacterized protein n=1 Tax=Lottia gigantea TaxID=225164 RepID=V3YYB5_LOTGI|nr:hypothetical protein LOTGIDRAFT_169531 [Lottia gigantea]ESO83128.1 hypothetical protein LOTGIDRAFT_169531 [Lottia gigantea]